VEQSFFITNSWENNMTVRYEYKSTCCGHEYVEQRVENQSAYITTCNKCGNAGYELVNETPVE
jgi:predicted SprT family Zn-dependent metalloprotease